MSAKLHLLPRIVNTPLLAHPRKAMTVYNVLAGRFGTGTGELPETPHAEIIDALRARAEVVPTTPGARRARRSAPGASRFFGSYPEAPDTRHGVEPFKLHDGVGIITITGALINRGAWIGSNSGETSYEGIKFQLARAAGNSRVKAVLLDIESPGGEAVGAFEVAAAVRQLAEQKPVHAVVNGVAASAAYAIPSGATRIVATPSGLTGSIGVVMLHLDYSKALDKAGISPTLIVAGAHKADANPFEPLTEEIKADLQAEVMRYYELFIETVATGRRGKTSAKAAKDTQARVFIGAEAIDAKLADAVGTFEDVLDELTRKARRAGGSASGRSAKRMSNGLTAMRAGALAEDAEVVTLDMANAAIAAARTEGEAAGVAKGKTEGESAGMAAALAKLSTILNSDKVKGKEAFALKLATEAPGLAAEKVIELVGASPAGIASVEERSRATQDINGLPDPNASRSAAAAQPEVHQPGTGWNAAVSEQNAALKRQSARH